MVYNLVIGGVIGVIGSVYYFCTIRSYVMENKQFFASLDAEKADWCFSHSLLVNMCGEFCLILMRFDTNSAPVGALFAL